MSQIETFIKDLLLEISIDNKIENGMFEIGNTTHMDVLIDHLFEKKYDEEFINELVKNLAVDEGKFPDRQAYNKDGWLVTFPSAEYRLAAIKRGTHFTTDPTKGRGGMNLYYKKRGKQKRDSQQPVSSTEPVQPGSETALPSAGDTSTAPAPQTTSAETNPPTPAPNPQTAPAPRPTSPASSKEVEPAADPSSDSELPPADDEAGDKEETPSKPKPETISPASNPVPAPDPQVSLANLTKQYASEKGWSTTPYGDWNDKTGKKVAVTGLGSDVVPIEYADRESLKAFVDRKSKS